MDHNVQVGKILNHRTITNKDGLNWRCDVYFICIFMVMDFCAILGSGSLLASGEGMYRVISCHAHKVSNKTPWVKVL